ncbi:MAG: cyclic nucleotide-binding domain-containing protein [bacterium]|nr:cyclic nucleotide-binding domain-containing protein [bacterium]
MSWDYNRYYTLHEAGDRAAAFGEELLAAYPLTRSCLGVLGKRLVKSVQFGFFSTGQDIIIEGEKGRDLFLLCEGKVDVLVGGKQVVEMKGPTLLGDKGIIESDSTRAATIRVAKGSVCLFLKIPMGLFIKDFKAQVPDPQFGQESAIFAAMFQTIQDRLFSYMAHQKALWEEANSLLNALNTKLIAKSLESQKNLNWDPKTWEHVKRQVNKLIGFRWPDDLDTTGPNLYAVMAKFLTLKMAPLKKRLKPEEYSMARHRLWQGWLEEIAKGVLKHLPKKALPIDIGEVELFNPKLFRVKLLTLLRSFEKRFELIEGIEHQAEAHFGKGQKINFLDLFAYLESFEAAFKIPRPNWIKALLAQKTAQIAAKSENEFNGSIVRMQSFLERVRSMSLDLGKAQEEKPVDLAQVNRMAREMMRSYDAHMRKVEVPVGKRLGEIYYTHEEVPRGIDLVKASGSKAVRQSIEQAYNFLATTLGLNIPSLPAPVANNLFYVFRATPGDFMQPSELAANYWFPVSSGLTLKQGDKDLFFLKPGVLLGGTAWAGIAEDEAKALKVVTPARGENDPIDTAYCLICLPRQELPWEKEKWDVAQITRQYTLILQWLCDKMLSFAGDLVKERDQHYDKWIKAETVRDLERRVQEFENKPVKLTPVQGKAVIHYLRDMLSIKAGPPEGMVTNQLSKQVYNQLIRRIKTENPSLSLDEVGNQAYTKFRLHLTEMVELVRAHESGPKALPERVEVFHQIEEEMRRLFLRLKQPVEESYFSLSLTEKPMISIGSIAKNLEPYPSVFRNFAKGFLKLLEQSQINLIFETDDYRKKVAKISSIRSQFDLQALQAQSISDGVERLRVALKAGG